MKILIAGSGKMGTDIFQYILPFGFDMLWLCLNDAEAEYARQQFTKKAGRQLRAGIMDQSAYDKMINRVVISSDIAEAAGTDVVIESIWEQASEKKALFRKLDAVLPADAILTSNTSSVPIHELLPSQNRSSHCCGLHFFFPSALKNLVEINAPAELDSAVLERLKDFLVHIDRRFIVLPEPEHFIMNRLLLPVQNEAMNMLLEYPMQVQELDALVRKHIFPVGIFEFFDHVGNDVMLASVSNYVKYQPNGNDYAALLNGLRKKVQENLLGIKTGIGFYQHPIDHSGFNCNLPGIVQTALVGRLEKAWYQSIQEFLAKKILTAHELDEAIMEYWGENLSFIEKGKHKGYFV